MRIFIAIDLSKKNLEKIQNYYKKISKYFTDNSFTLINKIHITLEFLGDIDENQLIILKDIIKNIKFKPFNIKIAGIGIFKIKGNLIFLKVFSDALIDIQKELRFKLLSRGFKIRKREFIPHITIKRKSEFKINYNIDDLPYFCTIQNVNHLNIYETLFEKNGVYYIKK